MSNFQERLFCELAGHQPYLWQAELFQRFVTCNTPDQIKAPTSAGKTMALPTFIAALATQASQGQVTLPRRLVFVVNRRVLVDDATRLCERIKQIVDGRAIPQLTDLLKTLSASGVPLAISTLRGAFEDNGTWSADPSTPAIILATPDMLGSRLLFRGYGGLGRNRAPMQAGLLGIDTLIVHDEAHLAPAFTTLLREIERRVALQAKTLGRPPMQVIEMTATNRPGTVAGRTPIECSPDDDEALALRMKARKHLRVEIVATAAERVKRIGSAIKAANGTNRAIAVFVSSPDEAAKIESLLTSGTKPILTNDRVAVLTGTMRGHERQLLLQRSAWRRLAADRSEEESDRTAVLIATGAGEIGIDLDAEMLFCDDATLDRQIQRLGRCNRRGQCVGEITVIGSSHPDSSNDQDQRKVTATRLLETLPELESRTLDASPLALKCLRDHPDYEQAIEPAPVTRELEEGVLSLFAATSCSLDELSAPAPAIWIHGLVSETPEIMLAWRTLPGDVSTWEQWLELWPVHRDECVRLPINSNTERLVGELLGRCSAIVLNASGALLPKWRKLPPGGLIVLNCSAGGLSIQGLPSQAMRESVTDVSTYQVKGGEIVQHPISFSEDEREWQSGQLTADTLPELIARLHPDKKTVWSDLSDDQLTVWLCSPEWLATDADESVTGNPRLLAEHLQLTARAARHIATALGLPSILVGILERAGAVHDKGKRWTCWQRAIGNFDLAQPLGKSGRGVFDRNANSGYRHELGSLVETKEETALVRQLVAAHHGFTRPTVRGKALIHPGCREAAAEAALSFAHFNAALGHWGLAYLEALLKCADIMAESSTISFADSTLIGQHNAETFPDTSEHEGEVLIPFDAANLGEYLAALGLLWLLDFLGQPVTSSWSDAGTHFHGVRQEVVLDALRELARARADIDYERASVAASGSEGKVSKYPPLTLRIAGRAVPLNPWCSEDFKDKSSWKLAAGRSDALQTLRGMLGQCNASLDTSDGPAQLVKMLATKGLATKGKGNKKSAGEEAQRFRYDAMTSWTALDVGWSPYEEGISFSRPWIEVLAALGIQSVFPPPARRDAPYSTWSSRFPLELARIAARGLLPAPLRTYQPRFESSGQNLDTYPSIIVDDKGVQKCPPQLLLI